MFLHHFSNRKNKVFSYKIHISKLCRWLEYGKNMYSELAAVNNVTNSEVFIKFWPKSRLVPLKTCLNTKDCTMQQMTYISEEYIARVLIGLFIVTQNVYQILVSILRFLMKITQGKLFKLEKYFTKLKAVNCFREKSLSNLFLYCICPVIFIPVSIIFR